MYTWGLRPDAEGRVPADFPPKGQCGTGPEDGFRDREYPVRTRSPGTETVPRLWGGISLGPGGSDRDVVTGFTGARAGPTTVPLVVPVISLSPATGPGHTDPLASRTSTPPGGPSLTLT